MPRNIQVFLRHVAVLGAAELREMLGRRRTLLALLIYALGIGLCIPLFVRFQSPLFEVLQSVVRGLKSGSESAPRIPGVSPAAYPFLVELLKQPPAVWLFQIVSLVMMPTLVGMASADMIATDIYRGTLRYALYRTSRAAYFISKTSVHFLAYAVLQGAALGGLLWVLQRKGTPGWEQAVTVSAGAFVAFLPFILCVVAVTQLVSTLCRRPITAVLLMELFWIGSLAILGFWPSLSIFSGSLIAGLVLPAEPYLSSSLLGYSGWSALFLFGGLVTFLRRDV